MMRVRFAPSPTGHLHVGGMRTALLNYIVARKNQGKFILRIEDTDAVRSKSEYEESILDSLKWLGIEWDEFYRQSDRTDMYDLYFDKLINEEKAYYCFCAGEEECRCKTLSDDEVAEKMSNSKPYTIKLKVIEKDYVVEDKIKGRVVFKKENYKDFIIRKSDRMPVFHFAVVIDDYEMKINFILRGEDHLSNTPLHMMIYEALGFEIPEYAHLPLLLGEDRTKLSKSHGDVSVEDFRKNGIINEALINYVLSLGVSWNFDSEIFSLKECIENIDIEKIMSKPSIFSFQKMKWYNKKYMVDKSNSEITEMFREYINRYKQADEYVIPENLEEIVKISKDKAATFLEMFLLNRFLFNGNIRYDISELMKLREYGNDIKVIQEKLLNTEWNTEKIMDAVKEYSKESGKSLRELAQPLRYIITGQQLSAGIFEIMELIGKEESLGRMENFLIIENK